MADTKSCKSCDLILIRGSRESEKSWNKRKHCSISCGARFRSKEKWENLGDRFCKRCGLKLIPRAYEIPSTFSKRNTCGISCLRKGVVTLKCEICGLEIKRRKSYQDHITQKRNIVRVFCSRKCKNTSLIKNVSDAAVQEYVAGETLEVVAERYGITGTTLGKRVVKMGYPIRNKNEWMLGDKNPTKGKGHTPETKQKLREANKRQFSKKEARELQAERQRTAMSEGRHAKSVSKLEDRVAEFLEKLGVEFERTVSIADKETGKKFACVDFLFKPNLVVEVNGTFWHADPRVYLEGPIHSIQEAVVSRDKKKYRQLLTNGFDLVVIWEKDIRENLEAAVRGALDGHI